METYIVTYASYFEFEIYTESRIAIGKKAAKELFDRYVKDVWSQHEELSDETLKMFAETHTYEGEFNFCAGDASEVYNIKITPVDNIQVTEK